MDLKVAYDFFDFIINKEKGGFIVPEEKDILFDRAQMWLYNEDVDHYAKTQELRDSLSVFSTKVLYTAGSTGLVTLPTDETANPCYQHLLSMSAQYYDNLGQIIRYKPIKFLSEDEITERLDSQILRPTTADPVGEQLTPGTFQLYPKTTIAGYAYYLRKPLVPFFSYTLGVDGRTITYDASLSVQLEWNASSMNKIIFRALQFAGVNLSNEQIVQYTEMKNQQDI